MRDAVGRGVGAVRSTERVIDVEVGERAELLRELGIVLSLPRFVARVLEQDDLARFE